MEKEYEGHPYAGEPQNRHEGETTPFVLSVLSLVFPGVVGLVLGIIALVKVSKLKKRGQKGSMITASYVMGIVGIVLSAVALMLFFVVALSFSAIHSYNSQVFHRYIY